jgi:hypothetical protein
MRMKRRTILLVAVAGSLMLALGLGADAPLHSSLEEVAAGSALPTSRQVSVAMLHFSLEEMVQRADMVFRGTVIDLSPGTVVGGGGELPAVTYWFRVDQAFKGSFQDKGDVQFVEVQMLGDLKGEVSSGDVQRLTALPSPPQLRVGSDYLLLLTPTSAIGLSAPVGLGQGSFEILMLDKQEWAVNEYHNAGLFDGPVPYDALAGQIEQLVGQ